MLLPTQIITACALLSTLVINRVSAIPAINRDEPPPLIDTLAVAKSPFEPVTLALSLPGARNDNLSNEAGQSIKVDLDGSRQTTRSIQSFEQERDATNAGPGDSEAESSAISTSLVDSPSTPRSSSIDTTEATTLSETSETDTVSTVASESTDQTTTSIKNGETEKTTVAESSSFTTTESSSATIIITESQTTLETASKSVPDNVTTTTDLPSTTEAESSTDLEKNFETSTIVSNLIPANSEVPTTEDKAQPETTERPAQEATTTKKSESSIEESLNATTEAQTVLVSTTQTEQPMTTQQDLPVTTTTTTRPETTTLEPSTTTSAPPSTTTQQLETGSHSTEEPTNSSKHTTPKLEEEKKKAEEKEIKVQCNHLPTYETDEVQKVFREETTYKNKTIKGKFTYINYDQRYRLVHYTRLPYGPVKIDLVEELGKPEAGANQTTPIRPEEIPNAVLQLRNILPNSLFGFPFLNPVNKLADQKERDEDRSNSYFYSTNSISTPNLLSPSVPISLLPSQRKMSSLANVPAVDTLSQSYYENVASSQNERLKHANANGEALFGVPNAHQFQYALASQAITSDAKLPGLMYTYLSHPQQQPQYQYSPVPIYSFNQPQYPVRQPLLQLSSGSNRLKQQDQLETSFVTHQTHQPHSHEHYGAPFMFIQPNSQIDQFEAPKLRLKVKTSKALNVNREDNLGKSAQLRLDSGGVKSSHHVSSPTQSYRLQPRQRAGKQNHELRATVNSSPVVYHVLRSPVGRLYSLPQYQQAHSMAYDHDNQP